MFRMAIDVVKVLQQLGASMLALQDGEGLLGLHSWSCRVFEPLLLLLQQQRSLALKQQQAGRPSSAEVKDNFDLDVSLGDLRGKDEEDTDLPFGGGLSRSASKRKQHHAPSAVAASSTSRILSASSQQLPIQHGPSGHLSWLHALALQAQGR
jgi:hypothetical protein